MKKLDRDSFDKLTIDEQLNYINDELKKGNTLTNTCKNIGIGRTTVRDRALKNGYTYNSDLNQYINSADKTNVTALKIKNEKDKSTSIVTNTNDISTPNVSKEMTDRIINLCNNHDKILDVIEWFENDREKTNVIEIIEGIKINLPEEEDTNFRKTLRVNDKVWEQFGKFCNKHKEFTQKDLLSQALLDYMEKHN